MTNELLESIDASPPSQDLLESKQDEDSHLVLLLNGKNEWFVLSLTKKIQN